MSISATVKNAGAVGQLVLIAGGAYLAYQAYKALTGLPSVTETANRAWWASSFGDLTLNAGQAYGDFLESDWGASWNYEYTGNAAEDLQNRFNLGSYGSL